MIKIHLHEKVRILQLAHERIRTEKDYAICYAIEAASDERRWLKPAARYIAKYIMASLGQYSFIGSWQDCNGFGLIPEQERVLRLLWIEWMIQQLEYPATMQPVKTDYANFSELAIHRALHLLTSEHRPSPAICYNFPEMVPQFLR